MIYYKDGAKMMRPVLNRAEYMKERGSERQKTVLKAVRAGNEGQKHNLVQMNYSCLPNDDGSLKGSTRMSTTVGMDIDHLPMEQMPVVRDAILAKKDELGLLMLERSARGKGYHLVFRRRPELSQEENLRWASDLLGVDFDKGAKDITRVFFTTSDSDEDLLFLDDEIFNRQKAQDEGQKLRVSECRVMLASTLPSGSRFERSSTANESLPLKGAGGSYPTEYHGIPFTEILKKYWEVNTHGFEPTEGDRDTLTFQLASDLRHICGKSFEWLDQVIPCYDGFPVEEKRQKIRNALASKYEGFPTRLRDTLRALEVPSAVPEEEPEPEDENLQSSISNLQYKRLPQGIRDSIEAVGPQLAMPVLTAICPCIGALATGVKLDVHGQKKGLNLIAYIAGEFASGKGSIDPVVDAWMAEVAAMDAMYQMQEEEWKSKKQAAKNKKEQPEEPKLPVRYITLNTTVAKLSERLSNAQGKHAFSFTPEADTVAQKWRSAMSDFSVMLRQSYDGSKFEREAKSVDAVSVHIPHLLWNVTMCGTPDALYRVVSNCIDGFQSRIAIAQTPDNTFAPLEEKPHVLTSRQAERIQQIAHLLPLMSGEVVLPKLERQSRDWVERIRLETMMNDDRVRAKQRIRVCVTAQRMVCCLMLCRVCETLIQKYGLNGAEAHLKQHPNLWREMLVKAQTPQLLEVYDVIADSLLDNALYFFRNRIERAFRSSDYAGPLSTGRKRRTKNNSIYKRLDAEFGYEQAFQETVALKGAGVTQNSVQQMLKNWRNQGLVEQLEEGRFRKLQIQSIVNSH